MYRGRIVAIVDGRTADKNAVGLLMATGGHEATPRAGRCRRRAAVAGAPAHEPPPAAAARASAAQPAQRASGRSPACRSSSILLALVVGPIVILGVGAARSPDHQFDWLLPLTAYAALLKGSFGSFNAIVNTLVATTPLILAGLSVALGFKAGLFNIGAQGQFLMGALGAVAVGRRGRRPAADHRDPARARRRDPRPAAFWGFIPGILKAVSGAHEVVTTIMLNYIALAVLAWAVSGPLKVPGSPSPITHDVGNAALPDPPRRDRPPRHPHRARDGRVVVWWLLYRTTLGFEIRTVGANPDAARYAGMRPRRLIVLTMSMCGGLAGLAGAVRSSSASPTR